VSPAASRDARFAARISQLRCPAMLTSSPLAFHFTAPRRLLPWATICPPLPLHRWRRTTPRASPRAQNFPAVLLHSPAGGLESAGRRP